MKKSFSKKSKNVFKKSPKLRNKLNLPSKKYTEVIRLTTYNLNLSAEQEYPIILRFGAIATSCERLMSLCTNFQQYKIDSIQVTAVPLVNQGSYPPIIYILMNLDREISPTSSLVIQSGCRFSNNKASSKRYKVYGLQNDMNYWFDCEKLGTVDRRPTMQWAIAADTYQSQILTGYYQLSITAKIEFRFAQYDSPNLNKLKEKFKENKNKENKKEEEIKEEEDNYKEEVIKNNEEENKINENLKEKGEEFDKNEKIEEGIDREEKVEDEIIKLEEKLKFLKLQKENLNK